MPFKIRTKLIVAFLGIIFPFLLIVGVISIYNLSIIYKGIHKIERTTEQRARVTDLRFAIEGALMPGNDYIITGDRKYIDDFQKKSEGVEDRIKHVEEILAHPAIYKVTEKMGMLKDTKNAWQNIKEFSLKIFAIPEPIGNRDASRLMEEMDYKWGYPAIERLRQWREIDLEEYREAHEMSEKAWRQASLIMVAGSIILVALGVSFALFYSKIFVKPIEAIHNGADAIAGGDFKTRLDIKTGDEIEQLSNAMNEMAEQLDSFYGTLERQVEERTKELQNSEDRYRVLGMTAPNAIICLKAPDTVTFWNKRATEIFGYSEEEAVGRSMHDLIVPERYREKAREGQKNFFQTGAGPVVGKRSELFALRRDGTEFPIELSISAMNIGGEWQATGIVMDITERKKAEEIIKKERDRAQTYLDIAGVMFVVIDSNEKVTVVNKRGAEILGCPEGEIMGKNWFDNFLPERVRDEVRGIFRKLIRGEGDSVEYVENPVLTCSGEERFIAWHNTVLKDETGKIVATLSSGEDITDRKKAEEKLKQRIDDLEKFRKITIKRELRMEELQRKVDELEKEMKRK